MLCHIAIEMDDDLESAGKIRMEDIAKDTTSAPVKFLVNGTTYFIHRKIIETLARTLLPKAEDKPVMIDTTQDLWEFFVQWLFGAWHYEQDENFIVEEFLYFSASCDRFAMKYGLDGFGRDVAKNLQQVLASGLSLSQEIDPYILADFFSGCLLELGDFPSHSPVFMKALYSALNHPDFNLFYLKVFVQILSTQAMAKFLKHMVLDRGNQGYEVMDTGNK